MEKLFERKYKYAKEDSSDLKALIRRVGDRSFDEEMVEAKKDIGLKTSTNITIAAISARNINKKRSFKVRRNIFFKNPLDITKNPKVNIVIELIGLSDGISKKIVERALKNFRDEIERDMKLMGCSKISELNRNNLRYR